MSGFEIIILIVAIVAIAAAIGAFVTREQKSLKEMTKDYYNNEEAQEVVDLAKELYNKDLRPIVAKKAPKEVKQEVSQEITKESVKKETKSEFPIVAPTKKKRKYYPKKKKD
jgi:Na+-transporting methylmalonyl-CoA/oxaloacetate decarboxylase gamma subunit